MYLLVKRILNPCSGEMERRSGQYFSKYLCALIPIFFGCLAVIFFVSKSFAQTVITAGITQQDGSTIEVPFDANNNRGNDAANNNGIVRTNDVVTWTIQFVTNGPVTNLV